MSNTLLTIADMVLNQLERQKMSKAVYTVGTLGYPKHDSPPPQVTPIKFDPRMYECRGCGANTRGLTTDKCEFCGRQQW